MSSHRTAINSLTDQAGARNHPAKDDLMDIDEERLEGLGSVEALDDEGVSDISPEVGPAPTGLDPALLDSSASSDLITIYLKEMSRVPLLSADEELSLAIRIENGHRARSKVDSLHGRGMATLRQKLEAVVQDGILAREQLIKANTRLVVSIAKRYMRSGLALLDLIQEGNLGLMKAVEKFEYQRGFRFSTYATWWIRQTINRAIADQSRTIRVPVHMSDSIRQLHKANRELEQKFGRQPNLEELAETLDLPVSKIQWILKASRVPLSLEMPVGEDEESELGSFIEDNISPTPMQSAYESMLKDKLEEVLTTLTPREALILRLRFGLEDGDIYTLEEVGHKFGLTRERIRQIEGHALRRLRHPKRAKQLKDYL